VGVEPQRTLLLFGNIGPIVIICPQAPGSVVGPLADKTNINYTKLHNYADLDALIELFGHVRALNPERDVLHCLPSDIRKGELQNHLILIGGIGWNSTARQIQILLAQLKRLPIEQVEVDELETGEVFRVKGSENYEEKVYFPTTDKTNGTVELVEDHAFLARLRNPFNSSRTLTIFSGVHSRGVIGAVLALTDKTLGPGNQEYVAQRFSEEEEFALLVKVAIVSGEAQAPDFWNPDMRLFEWPTRE
jgi:hypothetical protein